MTPEIFKSFVEESVMSIISQEPIHFEPVGGWNGIDTLSFFYKP
jgi:hypothetical protein